MPNRLDIAVISPEDSPWRQLELRFLIDGDDVLEQVFDAGPGADPDRLLGPDGLLPAAEGATMVRLAEAVCSWGCCGCINVRIHREGDQIVWDQWHNPDADGVPLGEFRFDVAQYEAELLRARQDRAWEWPGRAIARLTEALLVARPEVLGRWNSGLDFVGSLPGKRGEVEVVFTSPPREVIHEHWEQYGRPLEHTQYKLRFPVTVEPAEIQAERIVTTLRTGDPRANAETCGGYTEQE
ncbi:MAG TPA: hypothetical protein VFU43_18620 [Streptosporangiaceae bacterium]|nr:hypothetical protein [Streptosporangiaceae bacterium]